MIKQNKSLLKLVDELRGSFMPEDAIRLIYLLKAWKVLSEENKISDNSLTFEAFYHSKITVTKLKDTLGKLAKEQYLFTLSSPLNSPRSKLTDETLIMLMNEIQDSETFIEVGDIFYSHMGKGYQYTVPMQIADLGVKLLGDDCSEVYSPFSHSHNLTYFTDKKVFAESLADEFMVEVSKIIDHQDIEFVYTDVLEKPSYINAGAPHLLRQFDCTLSFPPLGHKIKTDFYKNDTFNRFKIYRGKSNADVLYFEHILAQTKAKAVVLMSVGFCYRAGVELDFRKYLVENNLLEAVIQLPANLHFGTSIETTFFIVNKNKFDENIQFINLNQDAFLQKGRRITLNDLDQIASIYLDSKEIENTSVIVSNSIVTDNSYSFSIDRYVLSKEAAQLQETLAKYSMYPLQEIADVRRSQMFKDEEDGLEVIEFSPSDMAEAGYTTNSKKRKKIGSQESRLKTYELHQNDILLSTKGTIGKVGIVGELAQPAIASQAMQVIRVREEAFTNIVDKSLFEKEMAISIHDDYPVSMYRGELNVIVPQILYMYLKSNIGQALLDQLVAGSAMPQIATREIKEFKVPELSNNEIHHIVRSFHDEIKLYEEIEEKKIKINKIHSNFLGEK